MEKGNFRAKIHPPKATMFAKKQKGAHELICF